MSTEGQDPSASASLGDPEVDPLIGQVIDKRYRLTRKLGEGGMGEVYAADHLRIARSVAIKLLRAEVLTNSEAVARFEQEAMTASSIGHENIIRIEDSGQLDDGRIYLAMELLAGLPFNDLIEQERVAPDRLLHILIQTCHGLAAAHEKGIVHRDMKPENIYITTNTDGSDLPKLLDFGIAKVSQGEGENHLTRTGTIFGTPFYMAPEQALGETVDHRVDVYAMGVIMYEVFCGVVPFGGESFMGILTQHITAEPTLPSEMARRQGRVLPPGVEEVILKAMKKAPEDRFQNMDELLQALIPLYRAMAGAGMSTYLEAHTPEPVMAGGTGQPSSGQQPYAQPNQAGLLQAAPNQAGLLQAAPNQAGLHQAAPNQAGLHQATPNQVAAGYTGGSYTGQGAPQTMPTGQQSHTGVSPTQSLGSQPAYGTAGASGYIDYASASQSLPIPVRKSKAGLIVAVLLLLVGGGAAAFFLLGKDSKDTSALAVADEPSSGSASEAPKSNSVVPNTRDAGDSSGGAQASQDPTMRLHETDDGGTQGAFPVVKPRVVDPVVPPTKIDPPPVTLVMVLLDSSPVRATIYKDGKKIGKTPSVFHVNPEEPTSVVLKSKHHKDQEVLLNGRKSKVLIRLVHKGGGSRRKSSETKNKGTKHGDPDSSTGTTKVERKPPPKVDPCVRNPKLDECMLE